MSEGLNLKGILEENPLDLGVGRIPLVPSLFYTRFVNMTGVVRPDWDSNRIEYAIGLAKFLVFSVSDGT